MNNDNLLAEFKAEAAIIDDIMRADLASIGSPLLSEVIHHAIFSGGKRVRPLFTVLAARLCIQPDESLYRLATTFEYLHAASLLHDDVIDHTEQRRGQATANSIWGNTPVILAGDYLHTRAMLLAGSYGNAQSLEIICNATAAMVEAEFLQMKTAKNVDLSEENYFAVLKGKTAALISGACEVGILHAGGNDKQRKALRTYGGNLGLAFQVVDDLLDYLGDPDETGKIVGNDFQEGKITLPLIHTFHNASKGDRRFLLDLLAADSQKRLNQVGRVRSVIEAHGGFNYAKQKAQELIDSAIAELNIFAGSSPKNILTNLAHYVLTRKK